MTASIYDVHVLTADCHLRSPREERERGGRGVIATEQTIIPLFLSPLQNLVVVAVTNIIDTTTVLVRRVLIA